MNLNISFSVELTFCSEFRNDASTDFANVSEFGVQIDGQKSISKVERINYVKQIYDYYNFFL